MQLKRMEEWAVSSTIAKKGPNLIPKMFEIDGFPHLCFLAADDIEPQQELMYDYGERNSNIIADHPWLSS